MIDDDRTVKWLERTRVAFDSVAECYVELATLVAGGRAAGVVGGGSHVSARPPIDVHVVDLRAEAEVLVTRYVPLAHGALRMGLGADRPETVAGLWWLRDALDHLFAEDPDLAREVGEAVWSLRGRVERACGRQARPYRIMELCPACGMLTLFVSPERGVVRCTGAGCDAEWPVEYPLLAWSSESGTSARDAYRASASAVRA